MPFTTYATRDFDQVSKVAADVVETGTVCESVLGPVMRDVPVSYRQTFVDKGGTLVHVLDEGAAAEVLARRSEVEARGCETIDVRDQSCERVEDLAFARDPDTGHVR